jgi:hypothetical protein
MVGKHNDLPTNKLVLASRYGFTEQALQKAEFHRLDTISLDELDEDSAERIIGTNILPIKTWSLTPNKVSISVPGDDRLPPEDVEIFSDHIIFNELGEHIAIATTLVQNILIAPKVLEYFATHSEPHQKNFTLACQAPTEAVNGRNIYLRKDTPTSEVLRRIDTVHISGDLKVEVVNISLLHGKLQGSTIAWGTTTYLGKRALVLSTKGETKDVQFSFAYL